MKPDKLFRGDKKGNGVLSENYLHEGLFTKLINKGDPAYISKVGLLEAIRIHIAPKTVTDEVLWSQSSFSSFSESLERALHFAADGEPNDLILGNEGRGDKQRYLFTLDISARKATSHKGIFSLAYYCDLIRCEYCVPEKKEHHLLLIDVVTYLSENESFARNQDALKNARRDSEWLLLPIDYIPSLSSGYAARLVPSGIWYGEEYYFL